MGVILWNYILNSGIGNKDIHLHSSDSVCNTLNFIGYMLKIAAWMPIPTTIHSMTLLIIFSQATRMARFVNILQIGFYNSVHIFYVL